MVGLNALLVQMQHRLTWGWGQLCIEILEWDSNVTIIRTGSRIPAGSHRGGQQFFTSLVQSLGKNTDTEARQTQWQGHLLSHRRGPRLFHCTHGDKRCCLHRVRERELGIHLLGSYTGTFSHTDLIQTLTQLSENEWLLPVLFSRSGH